MATPRYFLPDSQVIPQMYSWQQQESKFANYQTQVATQPSLADNAKSIMNQYPTLNPGLVTALARQGFDGDNPLVAQLAELDYNQTADDSKKQSFWGKLGSHVPKPIRSASKSVGNAASWTADHTVGTTPVKSVIRPVGAFASGVFETGEGTARNIWRGATDDSMSTGDRLATVAGAVIDPLTGPAQDSWYRVTPDALPTPTEQTTFVNAYGPNARSQPGGIQTGSGLMIGGRAAADTEATQASVATDANGNAWKFGTIAAESVTHSGFTPVEEWGKRNYQMVSGLSEMGAAIFLDPVNKFKLPNRAFIGAEEASHLSNLASAESKMAAAQKGIGATLRAQAAGEITSAVANNHLAQAHSIYGKASDVYKETKSLLSNGVTPYAKINDTAQWLDNSHFGRSTVNYLSKTSNAREIWLKSGKKLDPELAANLAKQSDPTTIKKLITDHMISNEGNFMGASGTRAKWGGVGYSIDKQFRKTPFAHLGTSATTGAFRATSSKTELLNKYETESRLLKLPDEDISKHWDTIVASNDPEEILETLLTSREQGMVKTFDKLMGKERTRITDKAAKSQPKGVTTTLSPEQTTKFGDDIQDARDKVGAALDSVFKQTRDALNQRHFAFGPAGLETPSVIINGVKESAPEIRFPFQMKDFELPVMDNRSLRQLTSKLTQPIYYEHLAEKALAGDALEATLDVTGKHRLARRFGSVAVHSILAADVLNKTFKIGRLARIAWPIKVIADEQARIAAQGLSSSFFHPVQAIGYMIGEDGSHISSLAKKLKIDKAITPLAKTDALGNPFSSTEAALRSSFLSSRQEELGSEILSHKNTITTRTTKMAPIIKSQEKVNSQIGAINKQLSEVTGRSKAAVARRTALKAERDALTKTSLDQQQLINLHKTAIENSHTSIASVEKTLEGIGKEADDVARHGADFYNALSNNKGTPYEFNSVGSKKFYLAKHKPGNGAYDETHVEAWQHTLRLAQHDPVLSRAGYMTREELEKWFYKSDELKDLQATMAWRGIHSDEGIKAYLDDTVARVHSLTAKGDEKLTDLLAGRSQDFTKDKDLTGYLKKQFSSTDARGEKHFHENVPELLVGRDYHQLGRTGDLQQLGDRAVNFMFKHLMSSPTDRLSRSPYFRQAYYEEVSKRLHYLSPSELAKFEKSLPGVGLDKQLLKKVKSGIDDARKAHKIRIEPSTTTLDDLDQVSKAATLERTQALLYDVTDRSQLFDTLRFIFPFGEAWREQINVWSTLIKERPGLANQIGHIAEGAKDSGVVFTDPQTNEQMIHIPLSRTLTKALAGVPVDLSMTTKNLTMFGSTGLMPGLSPGVQMALDPLIKNNPSLDGLRKFISPYGEPSGLKAYTQMPTWMSMAKKAYDANGQQLKNPETDRASAAAFGAALDYLYSTGDYGSSQAEQQRLKEDATSSAKWLLLIKTASSLIAPSSIDMKGVIETSAKHGTVKDVVKYKLMDEYNKLRANPETAATADATMFDRYGNGISLALQHQSQSLTGFGISSELNDWARRHPDLVSKYPKAYGFFIDAEGDDPEFNFEEQARQLKLGERKRLSQSDRLTQANQVLARMELDNIRSQYDSKQLSSPEGSQYMREYKNYLAEKYPGYEPTEYSSSKVPAKIRAMKEAMAAEPVFANSSIGQSLTEYFGITEDLDAKYGSPNWRTSQRGAPFRQYVREYGQYLTEVNKSFTNIWQNTLQYDMAQEEDATQLGQAG